MTNIRQKRFERTLSELSVDSTDYCTKVETRIADPWYVGSNSYRRKNSIMTITLRK